MDDFASVDWKLTGPARSYHAKRAKPRWFVHLATAALGSVMLAASYVVPDTSRGRHAYSATHTHSIVVSPYTSLERGDSLWSTVRSQLTGSSDAELAQATDELAIANGYCAPSVWAREHPDRIGNGRHLEAASCADGSANPHYIDEGTRIDTRVLGRGETRTIESYVRADVDDPGRTDPRRGLLVAGGLASLVLSAAIGSGRTDTGADPGVLGPHGAGASLAYGHRYLDSKDYLARTEDGSKRRLTGAVRSAVERKAARLNRLAAALDGFSSERLEARVNAATGDVSKRTARSYVDALARMGHAGAQAYLEARARKARPRSSAAS